jgi:hypothetical protein
VDDAARDGLAQSCADADRSGDGSEREAESGTSRAAASARMATSVPRSSTIRPSVGSSDRLLRVAVVLDADNGRRALADYRKAVASLCDDLRSYAGDGAAKLKSFSLDSAKPVSPCRSVDTAGGGTRLGVLRAAWGGRGHARRAERNGPGGRRPCARADARGQDELPACAAHGPRKRSLRGARPGRRRERPGRPDGVQPSRQQGVYPSTCGLFGSGSFQRKAGGERARERRDTAR